METRAAYVAVGSFVLVILVGLVIAVLWFARLEVGQTGRQYEVVFTGSVSGLSNGSNVRQNGVPIGRVTAIRLDPLNPQQVRVTVMLEDDTSIKSDSIASLELQGLTGLEQIEITGGSRNSPPLTAKPGERYPVIGSSPSGLQQVVTSAPELLARANGLMEELDTLLSKENREAIAETLDNLRQVTGAVAQHSDQISAAIGDAAAATHDLHDTLQQANQVVADLHRVAEPGGSLDQAIKSFNESGHEFAQVGSHLDALIQENRPAVRDFSQRGLAQLQQLLASSQGLVTDLDQLVQGLQRDPTRLLYGNQREGYRPR